MGRQDVLAVIPTRSNIDGLRSVTAHLTRLGIPARIYDHGHETYPAQAFLHGRPDVVAARGWPFYRMWNDGWRHAAENGYQVVAFLNDDITLADGSIDVAVDALNSHPDYGLLGLNWRRPLAAGIDPAAGVLPVRGTYRTAGIGGWAFLLRANLWGVVPPIDEAYHIWYGDDELVAAVDASGYGVGLALGAPVEHAHSATLDRFPELMARTGADHQRFVRRWGHR